MAFDISEKNKTILAKMSGWFLECRDLDWIQTSNLLSRNQVRYSVAPRGLMCFFLHFRPAADLRYFSLFLANKRVSKTS